MTVPPNDSALWSILRIFAVGFVLYVCLRWGYDSGFVPAKDVPTIIGTLLTAAGLEGVQALFKRKP